MKMHDKHPCSFSGALAGPETKKDSLRGSTERIRRLRNISVDLCSPSISMERAVLLTEAYKRWEGTCSIPALRGKTFLHLMQHRTLYLEHGALIVGEKGHKPWAAPTFPELCCHTLEDLRNMHERSHVSFSVSDKDREIQEQMILPYWKDRAMMSRISAALPTQWHLMFQSGMFTEFLMQRGPGHTVAGGLIYRKGYLDFIADIELATTQLDYHKDPLALDKQNELEGMKLVCQGMILMGKRYAALAREEAETTDDPQWREDLMALAGVCDHVPANAPRTFREALQMYWFTHIGVTLEMNNWDAYSPGKLDQHLEPFYTRELQQGTLSREEAKELLENLWVQFNNQPAPPKVGITLKESATYTDFCNINTGALRPDGTCGVSALSYLILEVTDEIKLLQPSSNVQISRKTPDHFLRTALQISRKGWGQPAFYNTEAIIQELLQMGKTLDDAREGGIASGCVETGTAGKEAYVLTGYLNIPKILELVMNRGYDPLTGKQISLDCGDPGAFSSYGEVYSAFERQLRHVVDTKLAGNNLIERMYMTDMPVPLLSVLTEDCISKGVDYNAGGARYNTSYLQCVGIATITDSLAVIRKRVFEEFKLSLTDLLKACARNFSQDDRLLELLHTAPKYGNDDSEADSILQDIARTLQEVIANRPTPKGAKTVVEYLPTTCHVYFGQVMGASPNGRKAGMPLPDGISPEKGADRLGPTAVIKSASKLDQLKTGGALLNQKFSPAVVAGETGLMGLSTLLRSYFAMDGHHLQFNVIDRTTLLDAQAHPEEHKNLIVRVAGYSDYFRNLEKALQDEIIERTEQSF